MCVHGTHKVLKGMIRANDVNQHKVIHHKKQHAIQKVSLVRHSSLFDLPPTPMRVSHPELSALMYTGIICQVINFRANFLLLFN